MKVIFKKKKKQMKVISKKKKKQMKIIFKKKKKQMKIIFKKIKKQMKVIFKKKILIIIQLKITKSENFLKFLKQLFQQIHFL